MIPLVALATHYFSINWLTDSQPRQCLYGSKTRYSPTCIYSATHGSVLLRKLNGMCALSITAQSTTPKGKTSIGASLANREYRPFEHRTIEKWEKTHMYYPVTKKSRPMMQNASQNIRKRRDWLKWRLTVYSSLPYVSFRQVITSTPFTYLCIKEVVNS